MKTTYIISLKHGSKCTNIAATVSTALLGCRTVSTVKYYQFGVSPVNDSDLDACMYA